jgi:gamma-glutamyl:cysteine ligase YbdK (ATP-grasp superfamily)
VNAERALPAFSAQGIEIELMIVDIDTLDPLPIADRVLQTEAGAQVSEVQRGILGWSNEMALHVIEIKNLQPQTPMVQLADAFQREIRYLNRLLRHFRACLMPTAMHPWMDPQTQMHLWPHDNADLYACYARIFQCRSHGWANLQSVHVNLPFCGDEEFSRLHAAVRLLLPLLPALAASSPLADGQRQAALDYRMQAYAHNADEIASITGAIIPDNASSRADYEQKILAPMYRDIAAHDPQGILQQEWLNSRGAIARFDRSAIEIRVLDTQETCHADMAIAGAVIGMVRWLYQCGRPVAEQQAIPTAALSAILQDCVRDADQALVDNAQYLWLLGMDASTGAPACTAGELLRLLVAQCNYHDQPGDATQRSLRTILEHGPLARRILRALDGDTSHARLASVYRELCDCLDRARMFVPSGRA